MAEHQLSIHDPSVVDVARWHVVRQDQHGALCGRVLTPGSRKLSIADADEVSPEDVCPACWAAYREQGARTGGTRR
ncbi:hypothetical protein [Streptacidiphilus rugosus]|uniref:hypothetical protein n=1 Tax=Streptacidiphilus rugosus TaxID=405783 RepID=UPI0012F84E7A|nr:hypothetical protein [Streptacidiphilus rugosus]